MASNVTVMFCAVNTEFNPIIYSRLEDPDEKLRAEAVISVVSMRKLFDIFHTAILIFMLIFVLKMAHKECVLIRPSATFK